MTGTKTFQEMLSPFLKKELEINLNNSFSKALRPLPILLMINEKGRGFHLLLVGIPLLGFLFCGYSITRFPVLSYSSVAGNEMHNAS